MRTVKSQKNTKTSRYFFQLNIINIKASQPLDSPITISILKGVQKLDEIKESIEIKGEQTNCTQGNKQLNFYTTGNQINKNSQLRVVVETVQNNMIGEAAINIFPLIQEYVKKGASEFSKQLCIGQKLKMQVIVFVEKTRDDLLKSIRSFAKSNQGNKLKTQPNRSIQKSNDVSKKSSENKYSKTRESYSQADVVSINISQSSGFKLQSQQKQSQIYPLTSKEAEKYVIKNASCLRQEKEMQQLDEFDSISRISQRKQGSSTTKVLLISGLILIALFCYFIITIEDQKHELSKLNQILYMTTTNQI